MSSAPDAAPGVPAAPASALEQLLRRERWVIVAGLALLVVLAWTWVLDGAGSGMSAWAMTEFVLFPAAYPAMAAGPWDAGDAALVAAMWWVMMVAMMTPAAAPAILLYARVHRHAQSGGSGTVAVPTGAFVAGYLLAWGVFAAVATVLQYALEQAGVVAMMGMGSRSTALSAGLLIAAGVYQFTPLKDACLGRCRSPATWLSRHWRPGVGGALRLGAWHGAWCVGCCAVLMGLLFVGGVMNIAWIAALTLLVAAEKILPAGPAIGRVTGILFLAWATATLFV